MQSFPIFLKLDGRPALVVGGGHAALAKARLLHSAGADLTVVAEGPAPAFGEWAMTGAIRLETRGLVPADLDGKVLAIVATGDADRDAAISAMARGAGVTVNVVDRPELSDFIMPAIVDRDPVTVAISTEGTAPVLARQVRGAIEAALPTRLGALARFIDSFRGAVAAKRPTADGRRRFWNRFMAGPVARKVLEGRETEARGEMVAMVNLADREEPAGRVAIVGAGPGNPEFLTLKAHRLLKEADVIVHDRLVAEEVLDLARRDARLVYAGKSRGNHHLRQHEINELLVREAREGNLVVRLKGGDPFVFGRGGEEAEYLRAHDIEVEIVPGITAANGCAATAGFPLTHRDKASAVTFLSGQGKDGEPDLDWKVLAEARHTLAVYMGVDTARVTAEKLIAHGRSPRTPVAVVENGTLPTQRVIKGHLAELPDLVNRENVSSPALIIIGEVTGDRLAETARDRLALAL
ncbi:MAG: siroheme synthase CysG [Pseudomonadota bacterium]|nr:siroheme synthase CysG [Pseudomonadota bacterium]